MYIDPDVVFKIAVVLFMIGTLIRLGRLERDNKK